MEKNTLPPLPDLRQQIHDLVIRRQASGLSPPLEAILDYLEAREASELETRSSE